ncbi:DNA replication initiation factor CDC45 [Sporobolomyces koalae]|uniref:DNA replication initiation factor CDC45 n=1 Tax=Sporobolomyces koalae TaxID=500713 RepID=UPI00317B3070
MFIPSYLYRSAYDLILDRTRGHNSCCTYLLVAPEVDALCAARLLSSLLKTDDVQHLTIPVGSWAELDLEARKLRELPDGDVRNLVMIGFGASADLYSLFAPLHEDGLHAFDEEDSTSLQFSHHCMIHVLDSHRPINLRNLFEHAPHTEAYFQTERRRLAAGGGAGSRRTRMQDEFSVVVWNEVKPRREEDESYQREQEAYRALEFEPDSDSDDSEEEEDETEEEDEGGESELTQGGSRRKRRRTNSPSGLSSKQRHKYRETLAKYEQRGTEFAQSVAGMMFVLAEAKGRSDPDSLWFAILGLTHQFMASIIEHSDYHALVRAFTDQAAIFSPNAISTGDVSTSFPATSAQDRSIRPNMEWRFCLFRHWTLWDAMVHSSYIGGKFALWTDRGNGNLTALLAKIGLSLAEISEDYINMSMDSKQTLAAKMQEQTPAHSLYDLAYPSFIRKDGYKTDLSASDYVDVLSSILEAGTGVRLNFERVRNRKGALAAVYARRQGGMAGQHDAATQNNGREMWTPRSRMTKDDEGKENRKPGEEGGARTEEEEEEGMTEKQKRERRDEKERDWRKKNFWLAWDALEPSDTRLLRDALELSMALNTSVVAEGSLLLDRNNKNVLKTLIGYRLGIIHSGPDLDIFQHPGTLHRLANWLVEEVRITAEQSGRHKNLPVVVAALNEKSDKYLVIGVMGGDDMDHVQRNIFGQAFDNAAEASKAKAQQRYFDASVVEVRKADLQKFLKSLSLERATLFSRAR